MRPILAYIYIRIRVIWTGLRSWLIELPRSTKHYVVAHGVDVDHTAHLCPLIGVQYVAYGISSVLTWSANNEMSETYWKWGSCIDTSWWPVSGTVESLQSSYLIQERTKTFLYTLIIRILNHPCSKIWVSPFYCLMTTTCKWVAIGELCRLWSDAASTVTGFDCWRSYPHRL